MISKPFVARQVILLVFGVLALWLRYSVMVTGVPTFQAMDNPASFSDSWLTRVRNHTIFNSITIYKYIVLHCIITLHYCRF